MLLRGGVTALIFIADGADASQFLRQALKTSRNEFGPLDNTVWFPRRRITCCSGMNFRGIRWLEAWPERHFRRQQ